MPPAASRPLPTTPTVSGQSIPRMSVIFVRYRQLEVPGPWPQHPTSRLVKLHVTATVYPGRELKGADPFPALWKGIQHNSFIAPTPWRKAALVTSVTSKHVDRQGLQRQVDGMTWHCSGSPALDTAGTIVPGPRGLLSAHHTEGSSPVKHVRCNRSIKQQTK